MYRSGLNMYWSIVDSFLKTKSLAANQLDSYNDFILNGLKDIIHDKYVTVTNDTHHIIIRFFNVYYDTPSVYDRKVNKERLIYPYETRLKDTSYETGIYCDIEIVIMTHDKRVVDRILHAKTLLFKLPVMLRSVACNLTYTNDLHRECPNDVGGYFIVNGSEKVIISQEQINYHTIYVFESKLPDYEYTLEIRSIKEGIDYSVLFKMNISDTEMVFSTPYMKKELPVILLVKAFDMDLDSIRGHVGEEFLTPYFELYDTVSSKDAMGYILSHMKVKRESALRNQFLPHLGVNASKSEQTHYMAHVLNVMKKVKQGVREVDDRDHINNKRVEMVGMLLYNLIQSMFKRLMRSIHQNAMKHFTPLNDQYGIDKYPNFNLSTTILQYNITKHLYSCFSKGAWGAPKSSYVRNGVSQPVNRMSYIGYVSHLNKTMVPIGKESRNTKVRQVHSTYAGYNCPVDTPEGKSCGVVKNFSILAKISTVIPRTYVLDIVIDELERFMSNKEYSKDEQTFVIVNNTFAGKLPTEYAKEFTNYLRELRLYAFLPRGIGIVLDATDTIVISCDSGRLTRPLIRVFDGVDAVVQEYIRQYGINVFDRLVEDRIIEYIDGAESENYYIAPSANEVTSEHHYMEIHPAAIFSICTNMIPFLNHSQAPRNVYAIAMMKQAIGNFSLAIDNRFDTTANTLLYSQKQLTQTKFRATGVFDEMSAGINCVVAVGCYTGYNQEDSVIINQSAIDRGLFHSFTYKVIGTHEKTMGESTVEQICIPPEEVRINNYDYSKLDENGIIKKGQYVSRNDVLIGKISYTRTGVVHDVSTVCKNNEEGLVHDVFVIDQNTRYKYIKVKIITLCIPEIGDKVASIHAQKGTIGMVYRQEDMPFTSEGITPDIILNGHCIPSRMTINMLLEMLCGKASCLDGELRDATAFEHDGIELSKEIGSVLLSNGYESMGNDIMYNGFTGVPMKTRIFIGPVYYQRLKHLVKNKIHARGRGNVQTMTQQPCAGRGRDGGFKFGEMEKDCMVVHGASYFLKERLLDMSDRFEMKICKKCGLIGSITKTMKCYVCKEYDSTTIVLPYAAKLLFQELRALTFKVKLIQ